jgi:hypothetical protein
MAALDSCGDGMNGLAASHPADQRHRRRLMPEKRYALGDGPYCLLGLSRARTLADVVSADPTGLRRSGIPHAGPSAVPVVIQPIVRAPHTSLKR